MGGGGKFLENKVSIQRMDTKTFLRSFWDTSAILIILYCHICYLAEVITTSKKLVCFLAILITFCHFFDIFVVLYKEIALYIDM